MAKDPSKSSQSGSDIIRARIEEAKAQTIGRPNPSVTITLSREERLLLEDLLTIATKNVRMEDELSAITRELREYRKRLVEASEIIIAKDLGTLAVRNRKALQHLGIETATVRNKKSSRILSTFEQVKELVGSLRSRKKIKIDGDISDRNRQIFFALSLEIRYDVDLYKRLTDSAVILFDPAKKDTEVLSELYRIFSERHSMTVDAFQQRLKDAKKIRDRKRD